ncbi:hypothetical protein MYAM1_002744 [Malassezia yamatoensis]|uniref:Pre-mRNA processing factor 4 (PRP4)-like domain-containing protein n=1 Tax=Malassezia yamatoensis TaxID=253288 RepID=A0AAJ5YYP4_9BASI|nr:hypothetical protein MYAM1_002744 [Malassezia yamatoensis]
MAEGSEVVFEDLENVQADTNNGDDVAMNAMFDQRKSARKVAVPTDDLLVRQRLREHDEPVTLFGEREPDRRMRLMAIVAERGALGKKSRIEEQESDSEEEEFYTEGSNALLESRRRIAAFSLPRAKLRLEQQRLEAKAPLSDIARVRKSILQPLRNYSSLGSQVGGERPVSMVRFSPNSKLLATGSWSGKAAIWDVPNASQQQEYDAHEDRISGLAWHPQSTLSQSSKSVNLATGGGDNTVCLWSLDNQTALRRLRGHEARVARIAFHPMGAYLASSSFDGTWRLWDVESGTELLLQEGHSKEVYALDFQCDGSLLASGGLDAIGRVWDCRTGRTSMVLDGHAREILSVAFAPNGYQIATASGDDTIRIWDMRKLDSIYTIPAHRSSVADVRYYTDAGERAIVDRLSLSKGDSMELDMDQSTDETDLTMPVIRRSGMYLASAGYDGLVKLWSADDWQLQATLAGDSGKVMSVDISSDGRYLASGEWARTFKLWGEL